MALRCTAGCRDDMACAALAVLCQACEAIDIDPTLVVDYAYNRMAVVLGERNGEKYDPDVVTGAIEEVAGFEGSAGE